MACLEDNGTSFDIPGVSIVEIQEFLDLFWLFCDGGAALADFSLLSNWSQMSSLLIWQFQKAAESSSPTLVTNLWYEPCSKVTFSYIKKIIYCLPHTQKCMRNFANSISYALMLKPLQSLQIAAACKVIYPKYILYVNTYISQELNYNSATICFISRDKYK